MFFSLVSWNLTHALGALAGHGGEHDHLGRGQVVQVVLRPVYALLARGLRALLWQVQIALNDAGQTGDTIRYELIGFSENLKHRKRNIFFKKIFF